MFFELLVRSQVSFDHIFGHARPIELLKRAVAENLLAHALLFIGVKGVGKTTLATAAAKTLLCSRATEGNACGKCDSCRRFTRAQHPDFLEVAPTKKDITIDQVRSVQHLFRIPPVLGKNRVVLIKDAGTMNMYAAGALLKTLEEPSAGNFLFLTVENERELFPTIVSRCQSIRLTPLSHAELVEILVKKEQLSEAEAATICELSGGSYGRALNMIQGRKDGESDILLRRRGFIERLQALDKNDTVSLLGLAQELDRLNEEVFDFLEIIKLWLRDILLCRCGVKEDAYANKDLISLIKEYGPNERIEHIFKKLEGLDEARMRLLNNGNRLLIMEVLLFRLAQA
jgi:DNA polymerase-3 subunit delta'